MDESFWIMELEAALLDDCTVDDIYKICAGKVIPEHIRPDVWQVCLNVRNKSDQLSQFNGIFDLPFQRQLRADCASVVEKLGNEDEDKVSVVSDLESILTFYCKKRKVKHYESQNGWNELLLPLLALKLPRSDTFNLFEAIRDTYIPKGCVRHGNVFHLLRLLVQYHDPELCSVLDTKRITMDQFSLGWFQTLFAGCCSPGVTMVMWDIYLQQSDPFMIFFLALTMLINGREQVLSMRDDEKDKVVQTLASMPCALEQEDVADFCSLAQYYNNKTPNSFKTDLLKILFGMCTTDGQVDEKRVDPSVAQALCLPVTVYELVDNTLTRQNPDGVKFFLVDCRPAPQYNSGHLATAYHLDSSLMLQEPQAFATAISGLMQSQKQSIQANSNAGGEHLCFMGSGRVDEDQYMHMVVASFLQKSTQFVSVLTGGYIAIHDYFGDHMRDCLEDHDPGQCLICQANARRKQMEQQQQPQGRSSKQQQPQSSSGSSSGNLDLFSKISDTLKNKSAEVKDKLIDYIVNPSETVNQNQDKAGGPAAQVSDRHVVAQDRNSGKRYRNVAPVFSIDDDQDTNESFLPTSFSFDGIFAGGSARSPTGAPPSQPPPREELVQLPVFLKQPEIVDYFKCQEVRINGDMYDSYLAITDTHLIVVRELNGKKGKVVARRSLASIVKILAKKRHRDLILFKYGNAREENVVITDMDQFVIPNSKEAVTVISNHIVQRVK